MTAAARRTASARHDRAGEALERAIAFHRAGDLDRAGALYAEVLDQMPANADALHLTGVLAVQRGQDEAAVGWIARALEAAPGAPVYLSNLGAALRRLGRLDEAEAALGQAAEAAPAMVEVQVNLGNVLADLDQPERAARAYENALERAPENANAWRGLGRVRLALADAAGAAEAFGKALERAAGADRPARRGLAKALLAAGDSAAALEALGTLGTLGSGPNPDQADEHELRGHILAHLGRLDEAEAAFLSALVEAPGQDSARAALRDVRAELGASAGAPITIAIPDHADGVAVRFNRANALARLGLNEEAVRDYDAVLAGRPAWADAHVNRGAALQALGRLAEAAEAAAAAARLAPHRFEPANNLGNLLLMQGRHAEARRAFEDALCVAGHPGSPNARAVLSNLLLSLNYDGAIGTEALFERHLAWDAAHGKGHLPKTSAHGNDRTPERRLRIGYVSSDFDTHVMAFFLAPIFANHDPESVELFCYAEVDRPDETTKGFRARTLAWRSTVGQSDEAVAETVRADGIDILVDLAGHTAGNRLGVFARKPAPVQASYLGYATTTGLAAMDWRIADSYLVPTGARERFSERTIALPGCFLCYQPLADAPDVAPLPALRTGRVTFGCFNNTSKICEDTIALWAAVLTAVPDSRLLLKSKALRDSGTCELFRAALVRHGIARGRIELRGHAPTMADHLAGYAEVDIALDTFPYCGATTTIEALWMGVPVVSLAGDRSAARFGLSILSSLGLGVLATPDPAGYVTRATELASGLDRLARLRASLRERIAASALVDGAAFTRGLEDVYRRMWTAWCRTGADRPIVEDVA